MSAAEAQRPGRSRGERGAQTADSPPRERGGDGCSCVSSEKVTEKVTVLCPPLSGAVCPRRNSPVHSKGRTTLDDGGSHCRRISPSAPRRPLTRSARGRRSALRSNRRSNASKVKWSPMPRRHELPDFVVEFLAYRKSRSPGKTIETPKTGAHPRRRSMALAVPP